MRIEAWRVPPYDNGIYLIVDDRGDALCVDPSFGEREVMAALREQGLRLIEIINTHGHDDHTWGNASLKEATRTRLAIHRADAYRLDAARRPRSSLPEPAPSSVPDDLFEEGPLTYLADVAITAIHTPGHTEGSTCFYLEREGVLFTGDVLLAGGVGRVDLPGGNAAAMAQSLARLAGLPPETRIYPGHGPLSTIAAELVRLRDPRPA